MTDDLKTICLSKILVFATAVAFTLMNCSIESVDKAGNLVPRTADEDIRLPQISLTVAGKTRSVHLETFGDPANPKVLVLHGGPGADFRLLRPLRTLADHFFIVMWDARGAGLSERVGKDELTIGSLVDEIHQIAELVAPNEKAILIGHSFGGNLMLRYAATRPDRVKQIILIEPGKIDLSDPESSNGGMVSFSDGQNFFWQNDLLTSSDHAAADYRAVDLLPKSARNWTCDASIVANYPFWRFGTYHYYIVMKHLQNLPGDYNWAEGVERFDGEIDIICGTCGALSEAFQTQVNAPAIPAATIYPIPGAGHISLFTDFAEETTMTVRKLIE